MGLEAGSMQPASQDLCCACCQAPLVLRDSCFAPSLPPLCQHCYPCQVLTSRLLHEAFLDPYVPSGQPVHRFMDYRLQAGVVSDRLVPRNACVRLFSGSFWQCFGRDFDLLLIPSPNPCASLRFEGPNPNLQSPVQHPSQDANTVKEANLLQAGHPCDPVVPRCMSSDPSSSPSVALGFRPDSAVQPPLLLGTQALGPASPLPVAIGFRPDSAVQPPHVQGTVSDSVLSGMLPQAAGPLHNVNSSGVVPSLRAHRAGAEAGCGGESPDCAGQEQLSFELPAPSASFHTADPNFILLRGDWQELHPDSCVAPGVCSVCQQEPVLGLAVDQEVQKFMQACSKAHQVAPREELHVAMHDAMSYCPHCLCVWEANLRKYRQRVAVHAELSGPSYFVDFEEAQELDDQDGSARLLCSEQAPQLQAKAVSGSGCRLGVPSSRRARRRYNRRLRRDAANQHHQVSLDSLIEPLPFEQGAPKTPAEEVETGRRKFCQEDVGRWPRGLGGPVDSKAWAPGSALFWDGGTELDYKVGFSFPVPSPCLQARDAPRVAPAYLNPNLVPRHNAASLEQRALSSAAACNVANVQSPHGTPTLPLRSVCNLNYSCSDVRPAGCTQPHTALPGPGSSSLKHPAGSPEPMLQPPHRKLRSEQQRDLWQQLKHAVQPVQEDKIVEVISRLEAQNFIQEGTFPWFAADLAMQACHGDDPAPAQSAIDDVLANLARPGCPRIFRVISANITVWRKDVANWMPEQQADVFMFQETHLPDDRSEQLANDVSSKGFQSQCLPALPTGNGGFLAAWLYVPKNTWMCGRRRISHVKALVSKPWPLESEAPTFILLICTSSQARASGAQPMQRSWRSCCPSLRL